MLLIKYHFLDYQTMAQCSPFHHCVLAFISICKFKKHLEGETQIKWHRNFGFIHILLLPFCLKPKSSIRKIINMKVD